MRLHSKRRSNSHHSRFSRASRFACPNSTQIAIAVATICSQSVDRPQSHLTVASRVRVPSQHANRETFTLRIQHSNMQQKPSIIFSTSPQNSFSLESFLMHNPAQPQPHLLT
ncbi:hypothetical protein BJ508DRAFT_24724 [Ascobolus immersus RN42]|uniref:Uncharacterized protein n=1 Tax=Ascobolus immersus RN42 TaxID=1160509 RepID=A0A3N4HMQ6_ASCIM|nr:hypothetical protein BJ508DRAFT_24724 [Ascobolus immersus RN42]